MVAWDAVDGKVQLSIFVTTFILCYTCFVGWMSPEVEFGLLFDAGSTGSRIHVFYFDARTGKLQKEILQEVLPGLSSYDDPVAAARSLTPLLDTAVRSIPAKKHRATPLALKATAGLRRLGIERAEATLQAVRDFLGTYDFHMESDAVDIMPGIEEAVYGWMTVNYLLGRLGPDGGPSVGIMDLGGGSTQIVFEPSPDALKTAPQSNIVRLAIGGRQYTLYQHSYDGYGLNRAREGILELGLRPGADPSVPVPHPCIPRGYVQSATINGQEYEFVASETPSFAECSAYARRLLNKDEPCAVPPCSFNGVFQPSLKDPSVYDGELYAFSYFFDRTQIDGKRYPELTPDDWERRATEACAMESPDGAHGVLCLDLSYQRVLLAEGYGLRNDQDLLIYKKINGIETAWCLGAMVALMENVTLDDAA